MAINSFKNNIVIGNGSAIQGVKSDSTVINIAKYDSSKNLVLGSSSISNINIYAGTNATGLAPGNNSNASFGLTNNGYCFRVTPYVAGITSGTEYGFCIRSSTDTNYGVLVSKATANANDKYFAIGNNSLTLTANTPIETEKSIFINNGYAIGHSSLGNMISINSSGHVLIGSSSHTETGNCHVYVSTANDQTIKFVTTDGSSASADNVTLMIMGYLSSSSTYRVHVPAPGIFSLASKNITPVYHNASDCLTIDSTNVSALSGSGIIKMRGLKMIVINAKFTVKAIAADTVTKLATINKTNYRPANITDLSVYANKSSAHVVCYCSTAGNIYIKSDVALAADALVYVSGVAYIV